MDHRVLHGMDFDEAGHLIRSRDLYRSHDEAITDMKRRSMKYIAGRCQPETQEQVQWKTMSIDRAGQSLESSRVPHNAGIIAADKKTVRELLLKLIDDKIQELEKKGILPKGKS
jgi:hypothetical protein